MAAGQSAVLHVQEACNADQSSAKDLMMILKYKKHIATKVQNPVKKLEPVTKNHVNLSKLYITQ